MSEVSSSKEQFAVGEVVLAVSMHGRGMAEAVVDSLPQPHTWLDRFGLRMPAGAYLILIGVDHFRAWPTQLLKRPSAEVPAKCLEESA